MAWRAMRARASASVKPRWSTRRATAMSGSVSTTIVPAVSSRPALDQERHVEHHHVVGRRRLLEPAVDLGADRRVHDGVQVRQRSSSPKTMSATAWRSRDRRAGRCRARTARPWPRRPAPRAPAAPARWHRRRSTTAPRSASAADTVDLPDPIPPVRPTSSTAGTVASASRPRDLNSGTPSTDKAGSGHVPDRTRECRRHPSTTMPGAAHRPAGRAAPRLARPAEPVRPRPPTAAPHDDGLGLARAGRPGRGLRAGDPRHPLGHHHRVARPRHPAHRRQARLIWPWCVVLVLLHGLPDRPAPPLLGDIRSLLEVRRRGRASTWPAVIDDRLLGLALHPHRCSPPSSSPASPVGSASPCASASSPPLAVSLPYLARTPAEPRIVSPAQWTLVAAARRR